MSAETKRCRISLDAATKEELLGAIKSEFPEFIYKDMHNRLERAIWTKRFERVQKKIRVLLDTMDANLQTKDMPIDWAKRERWTRACNAVERLQAKVDRMVGIETVTKP